MEGARIKYLFTLFLLLGRITSGLFNKRPYTFLPAPDVESAERPQGGINT